MTGKLVAEEGACEGVIFDFSEGEEWIIGRDPDESQLVVEDARASRKHLLCRKSDEGIVIENLSTTNPIQINDEPIIAPYLLTEGDRLKIGSSIFRFHSETLIPQEEKREKEEEATQEEPLEEKIDEENEIEETKEEISEELPEVAEIEEEEDDYPDYDTIYEEREVSFGPPLFTPEAFIEEEKEEKEEEEQKTEEVTTEETATTAPIAQTAQPEEIESRILLKVLSGPHKGLEYPLEEGKEYLLGSDTTSCDISFRDVSISRKHARLIIHEDFSLEIEDLDSRNGVFINGEPIKGKQPLQSKQYISLGTTTFLVIDKEKRADTLPTGAPPPEKATSEVEKEEKELVTVDKEEPQGALLLSRWSFAGMSLAKLTMSAVIMSMLFIIGIGTISLFQSEDVVIASVNDEDKVVQIIKDYPDVEYKYNMGELFVLGHVSTSVRRDQLLHLLESLPFVKSIDGHIIIDELVWKDLNTTLSKNPSWKGITLHSPKEGYFVLNGYLQTKKEAEDLTDYINLNFQYLDRLQNKVVVEEQLVEEMNVSLIEKALSDIFIEVSNGEVTLSGYMPTTKTLELADLVKKFKGLAGIRSIKNFVVQLAPEDSMINLTDRYEVTGHFKRANIDVSVVINGRILARGDSLDGMTITSIKPETIFLEKDGFKFRIDYKK